MKTIRQLLQEISDEIRSETGGKCEPTCGHISEVIEILDKRRKASLLVGTEKEIYSTPVP